jgi:hypothetical protein
MTLSTSVSEDSGSRDPACARGHPLSAPEPHIAFLNGVPAERLALIFLAIAARCLAGRPVDADTSTLSRFMRSEKITAKRRFTLAPNVTTA